MTKKINWKLLIVIVSCLLTFSQCMNNGKKVLIEGEVVRIAKIGPDRTNFSIKVFQVKKGQLEPQNIEVSIPNDQAAKYEYGIYAIHLHKIETIDAENPEVLAIDGENRTGIPLGIDSLSKIVETYDDLTTALKTPKSVYQLQLYLSDNNSDLSQLSQFVNLRKLELRGTSGQTLPDEFDKLSNLEYLDLSLDNLEVLPNTITSLIKLEELNIYGSKISALPKGLDNLKNLSRLTISNTKIKAFPEEIENLPKLQSLLMIRNQLESLPTVFPAYPELEQLNVSENAITALSDFRNCPKLKWITANKNKITGIPANLFLHPELRRINLASNQISELEFPLGNVPQSYYALNLRDNPIREFPATICNLRWLSNLDISDLPQEIKVPECMLGMQIKIVRANSNTNPALVKLFQDKGYRVNVSNTNAPETD